MTAPGGEPGRAPWARLLLSSAGVALLAGAVFFAIRSSAIDVFRSAAEKPWAVAALIALPLACLGLASASFRVLTLRFGSVGRFEMFALLGAAWLLNFLPLKPGVAGRLAYHKVVNKIDFRCSVLVVVQSIVVGLACFVTQVGAALLSEAVASRLGAGEWLRGLLIFAPLPAAAVCAFTFPRTGRFSPCWRYSAAFAFRYADSLVWAVRYWLLFWIAGRNVGVSGASAIAGVSQSASLVPIAGNGLGVREWLVGFSARVLPKWFGDGSDVPLAFGVSTELVNRACEVVVAIPVGLLCVWWLAGRRRSVLPVSGPADAGMSKL